MSDRTAADPVVIERLRAALRQYPTLNLAVLFGSVVAGTSRPDSDIDLAILPGDSGLDASTEATLCRDLERAGGTAVDLIRLDESASTLLRWRIATTGVPLVEAQPGAFARFRAEAAAEYIEFAPALVHHGEVFRRRLIEHGRRE